MSEDLNQLHRIPLRFGGETADDFRARAAHQQAMAAERREHELAEQTSLANSPADRIRIWERLHEITLPISPSHRLLEIIAANTGLTLEQVRDEQQHRAGGSA
ncbi:MAG: hypothetical protein ACREU2_00635, partial [Steroidobacteraceae bacterium]